MGWGIIRVKRTTRRREIVFIPAGGLRYCEVGWCLVLGPPLSRRQRRETVPLLAEKLPPQQGLHLCDTPRRLPPVPHMYPPPPHPRRNGVQNVPVNTLFSIHNKPLRVHLPICDLRMPCNWCFGLSLATDPDERRHQLHRRAHFLPSQITSRIPSQIGRERKAMCGRGGRREQLQSIPAHANRAWVGARTRARIKTRARVGTRA